MEEKSVGMMVKELGRIEDAERGAVVSGLEVLEVAAKLELEVEDVSALKPMLRPPVSTIFRDAIMVSMSQS